MNKLLIIFFVFSLFSFTNSEPEKTEKKLVMKFAYNSRFILDKNESIVKEITRDFLDSALKYGNLSSTNLLINKIIRGKYTVYFLMGFGINPYEFADLQSKESNLRIFAQKSVSKDNNQFFVSSLKSGNLFIYRIVYSEMKFSNLVAISVVSSDSGLVSNFYINNEIFLNRISCGK